VCEKKSDIISKAPGLSGFWRNVRELLKQQGFLRLDSVNVFIKLKKRKIYLKKKPQQNTFGIKSCSLERWELS